jgi:hypothetical protein
MKKQPRKKYSELREKLRQVEESEIVRLSPGERLRLALDLSDFCVKLAAAAKVQDANARDRSSKSRGDP